MIPQFENGSSQLCFRLFVVVVMQTSFLYCHLLSGNAYLHSIIYLPPPKKEKEKKEKKETIPCSVQDAHYPYLIPLLLKFCCQRTMLGKAGESTEETYRSMHNLTLDDADTKSSRADILSEILGLPVKPCKLDPPSLTLRPVGLLITKRVHVVYSSPFMSSTKNMNTL